jgi:hypothetical protein
MRSLKIALSVLLAACSTMVNANAIDNKTLVYINPTFYENSQRLLHPYYDYWFTQGPMVEPIAMTALQSKNAAISLCKTGQKAETVLSIMPSMFYNPQLRVYYSELKATVYSGGGTELANYSGKGQQEGFMSVDVGIKQDMQKAYVLAMKDLMSKIKIDHASVSSSEVQLPCNIVGQQTERGIRLN